MATIHYRRFDDVRVSGRWYVVLKRARKSGLDVKINSGHRTLREQTALFRQNMHRVNGQWVPRPGRPLTAFPTPNAPHILTGRAAHALDVDEFHGDGAKGLARWLRSRNVTVRFPVPGEPWHLVADGKDLGRLWRRLR